MKLSQTDNLAALLRDSLGQGNNQINGETGRDPGRPQHPLSRPPRVFLAYVVEDAPLADRLFASLTQAGFDPWMDRHSLVPGENWLRAIERGIETSRFFIACLSSRSVNKRSRFQAELRYALDCATLMPPGQIYFIPVRFDECRVPWTIARNIQYVDLFPDWDRGLARILAMARDQC